MLRGYMMHRLYENEDIVIFWNSDRCFHAKRCVTGSPKTFDINRKPWIQLGHADNKEVWQAISQCPSGALSCLYRHGIDITMDLEGQKSLALDGDKVIGECDYDIDGDTWNIYHTEVSPDYKGKGIAKRLVYKVIEASEREKAKLEASCSYAEKVIEE